MDASNLPLRFTIDIFSAHFVMTGRYFLILRIAGSKVNPSTVKIYVGDSKVPLDDHEFTTDACLEDGDPETLATFTDSSISFWMPPGACCTVIIMTVKMCGITLQIVYMNYYSV